MDTLALNLGPSACESDVGCPFPFFRNTPSTAGNAMNGSERPSPEPVLKKEASPAVLEGREFWKCSGAFKCLEL